jgi:hypothetical protein
MVYFHESKIQSFIIGNSSWIVIFVDGSKKKMTTKKKKR